MSDAILSLRDHSSDMDPASRLTMLREKVAGRIVFTTSFGLEDQYLTHLICENRLDIAIVTLDTGRLFPETYALWSETEQRYAKRIRAYYPDTSALEALVADQGIDGQYMSIDTRKACCHVRKVEPLRRALTGASIWITGLRGDQSQNRAQAQFLERDENHNLVKANPLIDWTRDRVLAGAKALGVPLNPLHERGFPSIGCAPCTRAVAPGEDERSGRWWWERDGKKECGLHMSGEAMPVEEPAS